MTTTTPPSIGQGVGLRSERGPVLVALMLTSGLVALDSTIIATAVPSVVHDLGGFSRFPWLFSIYLLTQAVSVPLYGKLADVLGRKPIMFFGIGMFLLGSVLCGAAWSMESLIVFRAVQGLGAGATQPMSMTIVGDMYTVEERARVQGYLASVWGVSSVVGPTLGGVFSDYLSWRWIFFVNLPLGALAASMLARRFKENIERRSRRIDYPGAVLLTMGCSLVILGLLEGGVAWGWASMASLAVLLAGVVALITFGLVERRAAEPILPLWVFRHRILIGGNLTSVGVGAVVIGLSSYVPTYIEGVLGTGALVAGLALAAQTVGWPLSSSQAGRVYLRIGFRDTALIGSTVVVAGTLLCLLLSAEADVWQVAAVCLLIGLGMGFTGSPTLVAVQSVVGWERRGVVTGTNLFGRSLGSAVGAAVFGAIANGTLARRFAHPPAALAGRLGKGVDATSLVMADRGGAPDSAVVAFVRTSLYHATYNVFTMMAILAALTVGAVVLMPRRAEPIGLE